MCHKISPRLKNAYISLDHEQGVTLKSPPISAARAQEIVLKRGAWILRKLEQMRERFLAQGGSEGLKCFYLGEACPVHIAEAPLPKPSLSFSQGAFAFHVPPNQPQPGELLPPALEKFYRSQAQQLLPPLVQAWSQRMGLVPSALTIKQQKRRWGSCSSRNHLRLNYRLVQLPLACIELVIVHELAHIRHKNHAASFWQLVGQYLPDYQERRQRLKAFL